MTPMLVSILPVTAEIGDSERHETFRVWAQERSPWKRLSFRDLPPESFAASGTRINTVILTLQRGRA